MEISQQSVDREAHVCKTLARRSRCDEMAKLWVTSWQSYRFHGGEARWHSGSNLKVDVIKICRNKSSHRGELTVVVELAGTAPRLDLSKHNILTSSF